jgi:serine/threonine protein kinase
VPAGPHAPGSGGSAACSSDAAFSDAAVFWARHEELRPLGHGHFGSVSLVRVKGSGALAAAKVVSKSAATARCPTISPADEAATMAKLRHPNIVRLLDVVDTPNTLFLLLEPLLGGDLLSHMRSQPGGVLPVAETRLHARSLMGALAFMHRRGFVHRDVKPSNVLLAADGSARLADFGLAAALPYPGERSLTSVCGTHEFIAPEMVLCGHGDAAGYGHEVDLWGMGLLLFACLYGYNPFLRPTEIETISAIIVADYAVPQVPPPRAAACAAAVGLIGRLLVADPAERWDAQCCLRSDAWLNEDAEDEPTTDNGEEEVAHRAPLPKPSRGWFGAAADPFAAIQRRMAAVLVA